MAQYSTLNRLCRSLATSGLLATVALLSACGGGGGAAPAGTTVTPPTTTVTTPVAAVSFLDSFGNDAGSGGFGNGDAGADGTAGDGAAIVNASIEITDTSGKKVTTTTDSQGYYRAKVTGMTPPLLLKLTKSVGGSYHSFHLTSLKTNGFTTINVSGLTASLTSDIAAAAGKVSPAALVASDLAGRQADFDTALTKLRNTLNSVIVATKLDPNTFNPVNVAFHANHTGYDFVLDNTSVSTDTSGRSTVGVKSTFVATAAYAGVYDGTFSGGDSGTLTMTIANNGSISGSGVSPTTGTFTITGSVNSAGTAATGFGGGSSFSGTIDPLTGKVSGTWANSGAAGPGLSGTGQAQRR